MPGTKQELSKLGFPSLGDDKDPLGHGLTMQTAMLSAGGGTHLWRGGLNERSR